MSEIVHPLKKFVPHLGRSVKIMPDELHDSVFVGKEDYDALQSKVTDLESRVEALEGGTGA